MLEYQIFGHQLDITRSIWQALYGTPLVGFVHVRINLCDGWVIMAQSCLNRAQISASAQQIGRIGMPALVWRAVRDANFSDELFVSPLEIVIVHVGSIRHRENEH